MNPFFSTYSSRALRDRDRDRESNWMEGKKQETANDEEGKETRGSSQKRGDQRGQTAKEEFLGLKLRRGITAAGRKSGGGAHTPVPTWKMEPDDLVGEGEGEGEEGVVADEVGPSSDKGRRSSVSARQLGASLWEIQSLVPKNKNGRRGSAGGAHRQRHGKEVDDEVGVDDRVSNYPFDFMILEKLFSDYMQIGTSEDLV